MYIVDKGKNELIKANKTTFKANELKERQNLQEWIAKDPSVFGEEVLIIQKEFDGFLDTRERLDLLALDKNGRLVIVENKLDDSGRDVTWQAIKYASYCSSMNTKDVFQIYQKYLDKYNPGKVAKIEIMDFLGTTEDDLVLNQGQNTQRIFLVAAEFQKEVTSSVLWLRNFNIDISCFKVTPCEYEGKLFVDFDKIIPLPETEEYQIKVANKEQEAAGIPEATKLRHGKRNTFWREFIEYNNQNDGIFANIPATDENHLKKRVPSIPGASVEFVIRQDGCRVEFCLDGARDTNIRMFKTLEKEKTRLQKVFQDLCWDEAGDKKSSRRVYLSADYRYTESEEKDLLFRFFLDNSQKMLDVFTKMGKELQLDNK